MSRRNDPLRHESLSMDLGTFALQAVSWRKIAISLIIVSVSEIVLTPITLSYNSSMDDAIRHEIANHLDRLAAEPRWNGDLWQRCYDLVKVNSDDELLAYLHDDLIHYTGTPLFRSEPRPVDLQRYSQEFRDFASALRSRMSLAEFKNRYEW